MDWSSGAQNNTSPLDQVLVYTYQDNSSDNFEVYYNEQGTQNVAGGRAPCMSTRPEIGVISGVRFYKGATNTGTPVGHLWSSTGTLLASATFTNETASGRQQVTFATPVTIAANTTYVASYHTDAGNYALTGSQFATAGVDSPPLHALANGVDGPNAVYVYGVSAFPTQTFSANNYWVDVIFVPR